MANGLMQIRNLIINGTSYVVNSTDSIKMQNSTHESVANLTGGTTFKHIPLVPMISVTIAALNGGEIKALSDLRNASVTGDLHEGTAFNMTGAYITGDVALDGDGNVSVTIEAKTGNWL